MLYNKWSTNFT